MVNLKACFNSLGEKYFRGYNFLLKINSKGDYEGRQEWNECIG